ncbi:MAG: DUF4124 domain-containing protein [Variovorax sp.]
MKVVVLVLFALMPLAAMAQWQWIGNDGKKVFSDQPPPSGIPDKNILRRGNMPATARAGASSVGTTPALGADAADGSAVGAKTGADDEKNAGTAAPKPQRVDKELEAKIRKAEEAKKAEQTAKEQETAKARSENCGRARRGMVTFDSGVRVARLNDKGEREIMDDKTRAAESERLRSVIQSDCG